MKRLLVLVVATILLGGLMVNQTHLDEAVNRLKPKSALTNILQMGMTELNVRDLAKMKQFYHDLVGLEVLSEEAAEVELGFQKQAVLKLIESTDLPAAAYGSAGLYHNAIVFSSRAALAQTLAVMLSQQPETFAGSSDHLVSEAFYFTDPEGNGLELYFDKDPETWQWEDGRVVMGSSYIDPEYYIRSYGQVSDDPSRVMGHVHLRVGDIALAKQFYVETLGLSITAESPGALFVSDGKYHHHLGMNTWESAGANQRPETLGLRSLTLRLNQQADLSRLKKRLQEAEESFQEDQDEISLSDPWGNNLIIQAE